MKLSYLTVLPIASTVVGQTTYHSGLNIDKCISLSGNQIVAGNSILLFDCHSDPSQQWLPDLNGPAIRLFENQAWCLDGGPTLQTGSAVVVNPCNPAFPSQRFITSLTSNAIQLSSTDLCIGLPGDSTDNFTLLLLENCTSTDLGQAWRAAGLRKLDE